ncbi:UDP-xylose and UDP-N-acetylglucosamine transporter [Hypsibius exemplaris]|uniref:UDP-xylose and UDP-N-acetylglucosamine transporter n=1 Tax=Hypsibius exemplaris TaxID=2072580 RepID=A0A1W0XA78_HYPEX|nr:UDP-xylose and UDP-N-acetylglucosamine transporter [Hypsibius exemplaris]
MHPGGLVAAVLISCCINVVILEMQISIDHGCTTLITFCQFLFIAVVGFIFVVDFGRKKPAIPIRHYLGLTTMFFAQSLANNLALSYKISMPLHMIVKSGSLVASLLLGVVFLKAKYPLSKWLAVLLVSTGIVLCTLASASQKVKLTATTTHNETVIRDAADAADLLSWTTGVCLVVLSVLMASGMGIYQEKLFRWFGRHAHEGIFYSHALPLPGFLLFWDDIVEHFGVMNVSAPWTFEIADATFTLPKLWVLLVANVVTQYVCSTSVFSLITVCSSLTVTLVITLRKFLSLFISVYIFNNVFTPTHWVGTAFVFVGTLLYVELVRLPKLNYIKPKTA